MATTHDERTPLLPPLPPPTSRGSQCPDDDGVGVRLDGATAEDVRVFGTLVVLGFVSTSVFWVYYVDWSGMLLVLGGPSAIETFVADFALFVACTAGVLLASSYTLRYGPLPILRYSTSLIGLGTLLTATAQNISFVILGRALQSCGVAPVWSHALGVLVQRCRHVGEEGERRVVKVEGMGREKRGRVVGLWMFGSSLGAATAPFVSHLSRKLAPKLNISQYNAWRLTQLFYSLLALFTFLLVSRYIPRYSPHSTTTEGCVDVQTPTSTSTSGAHQEEQEDEEGDARTTSTVDDLPRAALRRRRAARRDREGAVDCLKLPDVLPLSFASGAPVYSAIGLLWLEVSSYRWPDHLGNANKLVYRRFLPLGAVGVGLGALVAGILVDYLSPPSPPRAEHDAQHVDGPHHSPLSPMPSFIYSSASSSSSTISSSPHPSPSSSKSNRTTRRLLVALPGPFLLASGVIVVSRVLSFAIGGNTGEELDDMQDLHPREGQSGNGNGNVNVGLVLGMWFLSSLGVYSVYLPCILHMLEEAPAWRATRVVAVNDAFQLLTTSITFLLLVVLAQAVGSGVAGGVAGVGVVSSVWLVYHVIRKRARRSRSSHRNGTHLRGGGEREARDREREGEREDSSSEGEDSSIGTA